MTTTSQKRSSDTGVRLKRILLVDDDALVRESLATLLTGENYQVLSAAHGVQALEIAASLKVDLVLLDLNMPVKDGWQTLQSLSYQHPATPVIIITARPNQLFPALAAGVAALLEKPMDIPHLLATVKHLVHESPEARRARLTGRNTEFRYEPRKPNRH